MPEAPRITRIEDVPPFAGFATGTYRLVRRALGIRAFGVNAFAADAGAQLLEEHDETGSGAGRHEELYVVISGRARFVIDGAEHDAPAGTLVFVPDPESRRTAHAVDDGTSLIAIGGAVGEAYEPSPWETSVSAKQLADAGDPDAAADLMEEALADRPDSSHLLYNTACFEALAGRRADAIAHLRAAVERDPNTREWAAEDSDFDAVRDDPEYPA